MGRHLSAIRRFGERVGEGVIDWIYPTTKQSPFSTGYQMRTLIEVFGRDCGFVPPSL